MAAIDELIDEYLGTALSPAEMRDLAMLQVKNASVQDDAVQRAVANAQGVEQRNRSALEQYLIAAEQQAAAESQRALEMAQQRLNAINQNITMISTTVGVGKEGKRQLQALEKEKQDILQAFPQLGKSGNGTDAPEAAAGFDIAKMLESRDYSPEMLKRFFDENDWEVWDKGIDSGDLELYNALINYKLGALPDGMKEKMQFKIRQRPDLSDELKLNSRYSGLLDLLSTDTQGDLKKKDADAKAAAKKKKENEELNKLLAEYEIEKERALSKNNDFAREPFMNNEFAEKMKVLKKHNKLSGEELNKIVRILGYEI